MKKFSNFISESSKEDLDEGAKEINDITIAFMKKIDDIATKKGYRVGIGKASDFFRKSIKSDDKNLEYGGIAYTGKYQFWMIKKLSKPDGKYATTHAISIDKKTLNKVKFQLGKPRIYTESGAVEEYKEFLKKFEKEFLKNV